MDDVRWQQIDRVFQAALECNPGERPAFLDEVCSGDPELRSRVESLLSTDGQEWDLLSKPAVELAACLLIKDRPELSAGEELGHYRVLGLLGVGGMGEVYLAEDDRLGRKVALKVLPAGVIRSEATLQRFRQEARTASALNHPSIVTIHEISHSEGRHFIATEFIEGETLRQRITRSRLSVNDALDVAIQAASALAVAHQSGIIHRDIKPENIMLRNDGYVKVLDFGLAKLAEQHEPMTDAAADTSDISSGVVMGTVKYMSPEQARGLEVDSRSDIFSLAIVLYEMVAGRAPFEGQTNHELIASILTGDPPSLTQYSPQAPAELQRVVSKALRKAKEERYQTIGDLLSDLKGLKEKLELESKPIQTPWSAQYVIRAIKQHRAAAAAILAALFISVAALAFMTYKFIRQPGSAPSSIKPTRVTTTGNAQRAAISPDGRYVVLVSLDSGRQNLWIRQLDTNSIRQIATPGMEFDSKLAFSPDGNSLYFFGHREDDPEIGLYQIPVEGGVPNKLLAAKSHYNISVSPDGKRLAFVVDYPREETAVVVVNADGTGERKLAARQGHAFFWAVAFSPDGKSIACAGKTGKGRYFDVVEVGIEDGAERTITSPGWGFITDIAWLSDGSGLLMITSDQEWNSDGIWFLYPDGKTRRVTADLNNYVGLSLTADSNALVTMEKNQFMQIWTQPDGEPERAREITLGAGRRDGHSGIFWTPGGRIVYSSFASGRPEIWIMDADGSNQKQLTVDLGSDRFGLTVSPDGRYILFPSFRAGNGNANIWRIDIDGSNPKQLTNGRGVELNPFCSPDGKWVFYSIGGGRYQKVPIDGGDPVQLAGPYSDILGVSPDGKLMAYFIADDHNPAKAEKVGVASFEDGETIAVLNRPPARPLRLQWTPDARALTYVSNRGGASNIWNLPIDGGPPKQLTDFKPDLSIHCFAWSRDGKQLAVARGTMISDIVLIRNFR
jgi:serine/threonine protein kinase